MARIDDMIAAFEDEVASAERHFATRGKGGQQVPFFGDFASVPPSVLGRLRWWARALREARTEDASRQHEEREEE